MTSKKSLRSEVARLQTTLDKTDGKLQAVEVRFQDTQAGLADTRERLLRTRSVLSDSRIDLEAIKDLLLGATSLGDELNRVLTKVIAERLTMVRPKALIEMVELVVRIERNRVPGILVETGAARGGSSIALAAAKDKGRELRVYDVFGLIPPPTEADGSEVRARYDVIAIGEARGIGGSDYYGYDDDLYDRVTDSFAEAGYPVSDYNVTLVKGLFEDTLNFNEPIALAHLDGDWYESTKVALERIAPHLSVGGFLVIDDYGAWSGCRQAVDEYFANRSEFRRDDSAKVRFERITADQP